MTLDLFSQKFKANPFPTYAQMRREAPVYAHRSPNGSTIWFITRHDDVVEVLKDNVRFVKDFRNTKEEKGERGKGKVSVHQAINRNMLFADPPDHTRLRALVNQAFTPRRVEQMRPRVQEVADLLLAQVAPKGAMDIIADYALPLPVVVISDMLGIPSVDRDQVAQWSQVIISPGARGLPTRERKRQMRRFVSYLQALFAERQRQPQDDLISALVQAEEAGERLSEAELSSMVALLLVTGHETTVNMIGNAVIALLNHPEQLALLKQNPEWWGNAVEELLRYDGPVETSTTRWVARDCMFRGQQMRRGDVVRVVITSANRDEMRYENVNTLDVSRSDSKHLQFGLGIHYCLGAPLARLEGEIALKALWETFPDLRLAVPANDLIWRTGILFRGLERLPVKWGD